MCLRNVTTQITASHRLRPLNQDINAVTVLSTFLHIFLQVLVLFLPHHYTVSEPESTKQSVVYTGCKCSVLGVKRPGHEADHSSPSSSEVKNAWAVPPLPQYVFMACA